MKIDLITLFPEMAEGFLNHSMMKRAVAGGQASFGWVNPRDFATDKHRMTDDRPFGGGPGMVMKPEPLFTAVESVRTANSRVILLSPSGAVFKQATAERLSLAGEHLIFICGHYEGVDERVCERLVDEELSIGDYVLTNGALAAVVVVDAIVRLLPGVLGGGEEATGNESFSTGLLDYPQYTRPPEFRGMKVPDVLLSGDHGAIEQWRQEQAIARTQARREDLLKLNREKDENNT
ncbi:MAG: tRNA (guanosine(37)-N1)-methyltransferase TrmD [Kiritimatiellaceae bacterium]|nr:MAG: tRNA (guanosine(37)-N1)-methyltransferase TrmD [Kiritimatiellaceae bacterium]|tara:strand:+ start:4668 stop:5372 length:705 start_codon:yes stop_codon:yes gene_type:complete